MKCHIIIYEVRSWSIDTTPYNYPEETKNELGHTMVLVTK